MSTETRSRSDGNLTSLVTGILDDVQRLMKQHLQLFMVEVKSDYKRSREALLYIVGGAALCIPGIMLLSLMLVHGLHSLTLPENTDPARLPLWACYAIVGALFTLPGIALIFAGLKKFQSFNPLPDESMNALRNTWEQSTASDRMGSAPVAG